MELVPPVKHAAPNSSAQQPVAAMAVVGMLAVVEKSGTSSETSLEGYSAVDPTTARPEKSAVIPSVRGSEHVWPSPYVQMASISQSAPNHRIVVLEKNVVNPSTSEWAFASRKDSVPEAAEAEKEKLKEARKAAMANLEMQGALPREALAVTDALVRRASVNWILSAVTSSGMPLARGSAKAHAVNAGPAEKEVREAEKLTGKVARLANNQVATGVSVKPVSVNSTPSAVPTHGMMYVSQNVPTTVGDVPKPKLDP